jgi:hypothetical protein
MGNMGGSISQLVTFIKEGMSFSKPSGSSDGAGGGGSIVKLENGYSVYIIY